MHHAATISEGRFEERPFHVACSCGTQGDFATEQAATEWLNLVHFARRGPTETCELISNLSSAPTTESAPETSETSGAVQVSEGEQSELKESLGDS